MNIHVQVEICTPIHTSQERLCTVLSYYDHRHYILPKNVYVQFSLITIIANTSFPVTFMYRSLLFDYGQYILLRDVYTVVHSYYDYSQYILPRNVYVQFSLIMIIANTYSPGTFMYVQFSLIMTMTTANTYSPGTFMYSSLLLRF